MISTNTNLFSAGKPLKRVCSSTDRDDISSGNDSMVGPDDIGGYSGQQILTMGTRTQPICVLHLSRIYLRAEFHASEYY